MAKIFKFLSPGLKALGWRISDEKVFDTLKISGGGGGISPEEIQRRCDKKKINIRHFGSGTVSY